MTQQTQQSVTRTRMIKIVFGVMAFVCLVTGLAVYLLAEQLGFSEETAQVVAIAFLAAGVGDYLILKFWDRLLNRH